MTWAGAPHFSCGWLSVLLLLDLWPLGLKVMGSGLARTLERVSGMCNLEVCGEQVLFVLDLVCMLFLTASDGCAVAKGVVRSTRIPLAVLCSVVFVVLCCFWYMNARSTPSACARPCTFRVENGSVLCPVDWLMLATPPGAGLNTEAQKRSNLDRGRRALEVAVVERSPSTSSNSFSQFDTVFLGLPHDLFQFSQH